MATLNQKKISGKYRDELRGVVAIYLLSVLHSDKGAMPQKEQEKLMEVMFHGDEAHASHKAMIVNGKGMFLVTLFCFSSLLLTDYLFCLILNYY